MRRTRACGIGLLATLALAAAGAPVLTPHNPFHQFRDLASAPPMMPTINRLGGGLRAPAVRPLELVDRLENRYRERAIEKPVRLFRDGLLLSIDESDGPWLPLGSDALGRDVFARLLYGARQSLGVAFAASLAALAIGSLAGAVAGYVGGRTETWVMSAADFVLVLPALYVALALRAALPLVLSTGEVFAGLVAVLAAVGWPLFARGVRGILAAERNKEYAEAAYSMGASPLRILLRHLLPATRGFAASMLMMTLPAFLLAEGTLSLVGLGFPVPTPSWGVMLRDALQGAAFTDAPWLLAPAAALVLTVFAVFLIDAKTRIDRPLS